MPRTTAAVIRVKGADLVRALHAAAAFAHADKKSHRYRIHLATAHINDHKILMVGGGSPTRVLLANAGKADGNDFLRLDLTPAAAALIVRVFTGSGDVALKHDGKTLTITAQDQLFDNQRIEVRALRVDERANPVRITALGLSLSEPIGVLEQYVATSPDNQAAIAKAAKALGIAPAITPVDYHDGLGLRVAFGAAAIGFLRASQASSALAYWDDATLADLEHPEPWYAEHINLGHILDGVAPLKPTTITLVDDAAEDSDDDGVDLDDIDYTDASTDAGAA